MKVLIVEDEPKVAQIFTSHFQRQGHEVFTSDTGDGALEQLKQHQPEFMLLDLWLKDSTNGMMVLKQLRQVSPKTVTVVSTGLEETSQDEVIRLGAAALLRKPVRLDELDALVTSLVPAAPTTTA